MLHGMETGKNNNVASNLSQIWFCFNPKCFQTNRVGTYIESRSVVIQITITVKIAHHLDMHIPSTYSEVVVEGPYLPDFRKMFR